MTKITERGWAGHFICAERCTFRRNTLIEHNGTGVVVSSVGAMRNLDGKIATVGCNRWYETMAWYAKDVDENGYVEMDVDREISLNCEWGIFVDPKTLPGVDNVANNIHEAAVREITQRLESGEL
jgi:hypothetical protein